MANISKDGKNLWVRDGLEKRGYRQKDLARAWAVAEGSVSRFISGEEGAKMSLEKAATLARMLDVSLEELARGLGVGGQRVEPSVPPTSAGSAVPVGTMSMNVVGQGVMRVLLHQDVTTDTATQIVGLVSAGAVSSPSR